MLNLEQVIAVIVRVISQMTRKDTKEFGPDTVIKKIKGLDINALLKFIETDRETKDDTFIPTIARMFRLAADKHIKKGTTVKELAVRLMGSLTHMEEESSGGDSTDPAESD